MATFRKRKGKWQVQVRRSGCSPISKFFIFKSDADAWAKAGKGWLAMQACCAVTSGGTIFNKKVKKGKAL